MTLKNQKLESKASTTKTLNIFLLTSNENSIQYMFKSLPKYDYFLAHSNK